MKIHCLGTVGYHPNESRHTSAYFLPDSGILLDAGSGIFRLPPLIKTPQLHILLSHAHLDHTVGLTFLIDVLYQRPVDELHIWGEASKLKAVQDHLFHELIFPAKLDCTWHAIDELESLHIQDTSVRWRYQPHPGGSVAYRIDWTEQDNSLKNSPGNSQEAGKRLVYASDTSGDVSEEHAQWSKDADLLMHECYFKDTFADWAEKTGHSWSSRVADVASKSTPKKLLLTHTNPLETSADPVDIEIIRSKTNAEVLLAEDGLEVVF